MPEQVYVTYGPDKPTGQRSYRIRCSKCHKELCGGQIDGQFSRIMLATIAARERDAHYPYCRAPAGEEPYQ